MPTVAFEKPEAKTEETEEPTEAQRIEMYNLARLLDLGVPIEDAEALAPERDAVGRARALLQRGVPPGYVRRLL